MYRPKSSNKKCHSALDAESSSLALATISILLASLMVFSFGCVKKEEKEIKIGVVTPLTGDNASYGQQTKEGVDLAVEEINIKGGIEGKKIIVKYEDDQSSQNGGISAFQKLITSEKVPVVIGGFTSSVTLAIAPVAEKNKVVLISASSTSDDIKNAGDYIFRIVPTNSVQGKTMADFAIDKLKAKTAAILFMNNDYGTTLKNGVNKHFTERGGTIALIESYNPKDNDFRSQLSKIKAKKVDVIFYPGLYEESGLILKQARELGIKLPFIGGDGTVDPKLIEIAKDAAENTYYANLGLGFGVSDAEISKFTESFKKKYGKEPSAYNSYAYDVIFVISDAIKVGGYTFDGIKKALYETKGFKGVTGLTTFDNFGEVDKPFYVYAVKRGNFEIVK